MQEDDAYEQHDRNVRALQVAKAREGVTHAPSEEERRALLGFVGWSDPEVRRCSFDWRDKPSGDLRQLITDDEAQAALRATPHAPIDVDPRVAEGLGRVAVAASLALGNLSGARVVDLCAGAGRVAAMLPASLASVVAAYVPCLASARVAAALAPTWVKVLRQTPQSDAVPLGWFDMAIGAGPAGVGPGGSVYDGDDAVPRVVRLGGSTAWYLARAVLSVRTGGVAALFVNPQILSERTYVETINALQWVARRAELLSWCRVDGGPLAIVLRRRPRLVSVEVAKGAMWCFDAEPARVTAEDFAVLLSDDVSAALIGADVSAATEKRRPARRGVNLAESLALDVYATARRAFDLQAAGDPTAEAALVRAHSKRDMLVGKYGALVAAEHDKAHPLRGLVGSREWRLLRAIDAAGPVRSASPAPADKDPSAWLAHWRDLYGSSNVTKIAEHSEIAEADLVEALSDRVVRDPETGNWVTRAELLGGDVGGKLRAARALERLDPLYTRAAALLSASAEEALIQTGADPHVPLGAPWLPQELVHEFAMHVTGATHRTQVKCVKLGCGGGWAVSCDVHHVMHSVQSVRAYGTEWFPSLEVLQHGLNLKTPDVYVTETDRDGVERKRRDRQATAEALGKLEEMREEWQRWLRVDDERWTLVRRAYAERFGAYQRRTYDGSDISFAGMSLLVNGQPFDPRTHQREAVEQIASDYGPDNSYLVVHHVGYGKTASWLAGAVRRWQLGRCDRAIAVVPKNVFRQWRTAAAQLYPTLADEFLFAPEHFTGEARETFLTQAAVGGAAFVFMTYEHFATIPPSEEGLREHVRAQLRPLEELIDGLGSRDKEKSKALGRVLAGRRRSAERLCDKAAHRWLKLREKAAGARIWTWEEIVGDPSRCLLLAGDEWQYLKRLPIHTRMTKVSGLPSDESLRAMDALVKVRYVGDGGGKVGGLTGTPLTNSLAEAYVAMVFFQPNRLRMLGLSEFDDWAATFTEPVTGVEMDAVGNFRPVTRLRFVNVPELIGILGEVWNFASRSDEVSRPDLVGGEPIIVEVEGSPALREYVFHLARRAEAIRAGEVSPDEDNMLKVTSDGRKAAMWNGEPSKETFPKTPEMPRTANGHCEECAHRHPEGQSCRYVFSDGSGNECECGAHLDRRRTKLDACADNVWKVYEQHHDDRGVQLVFLDLGTPKGAVSDDMTPEEVFATTQLYGALTDRLLARGILRQQIAYVHDAKNDHERDELFRRVNAGEIRVLVGSTDKLGVGTNPQRRVVAVHHLDCPWRPDQLTQRTGRGRRNGNLWNAIYEYLYVTTRSYDVCLWQLIQAKADFASKLQEGVAVARNIDDLGDLVLTSAMAKALALGDERVVHKIKLETDLAHLERQYRGWQATLASARKELGEAPAKLEAMRVDLAATEAAQDLRIRLDESEFRVRIRGVADPNLVERRDRVEANQAVFVLSQTLKPIIARKPMQIGEYRGKALYLAMVYGAAALRMELGARSTITVNNIHASGTFEQLDRELGMLEVRAKALRKTVEQEERRIEGIRAEMAKPWAHLDKTLDKLTDYEVLCDALSQRGEIDRRPFNFLREEDVENRIAQRLAEAARMQAEASRKAEQAVADAAELRRQRDEAKAETEATRRRAIEVQGECAEALRRLETIQAQRRADAQAEIAGEATRWSAMAAELGERPTVLPVIMFCPHCGTQHLDEGEWSTRPHHTHLCQNPLCVRTWRVEPYVRGIGSAAGALAASEAAAGTSED